jgi:23S rRNA pseudouridine2605 synthase
LGFCSRREAWLRIQAGDVQVNGVVIRNPEHPVEWRNTSIQVNGVALQPAQKIYLMLNKPRGLVTTTSDEQGRDTVYSCLNGADLPFVSAIGRLDKASEGLLLFSNDTAFAERLTSPASHVEKTYHVQVNGRVDEQRLARMRQGVLESGELLTVRHVALLRAGEKNCWLEIVLDEGRNRHIRRLLDALGLEVLRLVRTSIGSLQLGDLAKGRWRFLRESEVASLTSG